jgi:hypothetical protein
MLVEMLWPAKSARVSFFLVIITITIGTTKLLLWPYVVDCCRAKLEAHVPCYYCGSYPLTMLWKNKFLLDFTGLNLCGKDFGTAL